MVTKSEFKSGEKFDARAILFERSFPRRGKVFAAKSI
jgi:hypothetical protein